MKEEIGGSDGRYVTTRLGGVDDNQIDNMSGGWGVDFTVPSDGIVSLDFRYKLFARNDFGPTECQQAMVSLDGAVLQFDGNDYFERDCDGGSSGWLQKTLSLGVLSAGTHTLVFGGHANTKNSVNEIAWIDIDDVELNFEAAQTLNANVHTWMLNRISDRSGNYITFTYFKDAATGEQRLDRVDFTGNDSEGLAPYNHVQMVYEDRPDPAIGYMAGSPVNLTKRLTKIEVYAEGALYREYQLDYEPDSHQLTALRECNSLGDCLSDTTFTWQHAGPVASPDVGFDKTAS